MTFRTDYLKNRYLEQSRQVDYYKSRIFGPADINDKFTSGTLMFAQNTNCFNCSSTCGQCFTLCPGVCYPGTCFVPATVFLGEAYNIAGCTCMPYRAWCHCGGSDCFLQPGCTLGSDTCWMPLSKMCGGFAGLVIRVN